MTDLVERLRSWAVNRTRSITPEHECHEAADEIERLRAEVLEQCRLNGMGGSREAKLRAERDQMAGVIKLIEDILQDFDGEHVWQQAQQVVAEHDKLRARVAELEAERRRPCGDEQDCIWQPRCGMARRCLRPSGGLIAPIESVP